MKIEDKNLILVDVDDNIIGEETKEKTHQGDGLLHRAVATFIFNKKDEVLITRRSKFKKLWPKFWDASCCTDVRTGETYEQAGERRLPEELGFSSKLEYLFKFQYQEKFKNKGSEHEICATLTGLHDGKFTPNPEEIMDHKWISLHKLKADTKKNPNKYAPWLKIALRRY